MKKTWVKRDNIYYKPFYKQKFKMTLLGVILMGMIFFSYQFFYISQLQESTSSSNGNLGYLAWSSRKERPVGSSKNSSSHLNGVVAGMEKKDNYERKILRGIRLRDLDLYSPRPNTSFKCIHHKDIELSFAKINDDYCDCPDGSDEPSTNACSNGVFYCKFQMRHKTGRGRDFFVASSRVNDGICDCCDGSDEWLHVTLRGSLFKECPNQC